MGEQLWFRVAAAMVVLVVRITLVLYSQRHLGVIGLRVNNKHAGLPGTLGLRIGMDTKWAGCGWVD